MLKLPIDLVTAAKQTITEVEGGSGIDEYALVIDVREPSEYAQGRIPNSINIPRGILEFEVFVNQRVGIVLDNADHPEKLPVLLYCKSGARSALAALALQGLGFERVSSLSGGYESWASKNS